MNFLGMGPLELLLIFALALIVFGPEKLPEIGSQIGRAVRDFRRTTSELSDEFQRNLQLEVDERRIDGSVRPRSAPTLPPQPELRAAQPPAPPPRAAEDDELQPPY